MINLPFSLDDSDFFTNDPFVVFEITDFISPDLFDALASDILFFISYTDKSNNGSKLTSTFNFKDIKHIPNLKIASYISSFFSNSMVNFFKRTHSAYFPDTKYFLFTKNPSFIPRLLAKIFHFFKIPIGIIYFEVEFSKITSGSFIPPHTDLKSKRLSLVHYISPNSSFDSKVLGTNFYTGFKSNLAWRRFDCRLLDQSSFDDFYKHHTIFHTSLFVPNKCIGFIKSDISWHDVQKNTSSYDRYAVVINAYDLVSQY